MINALKLGIKKLIIYQLKYNGKELQTELGLNLYDYGFRNYDQALGRWMNMDNLAEKFITYSPYHYAGNNPVSNIDVDGNEFTDSAWEWINKLIANINSKQESNNSEIAEYKSRIDAGGSKRQLKNWNKSIEALSKKNTQLEGIRTEIAVLDASDQIYDVIQNGSGTTRDMLGNSSTTNSTNFNFEKGNVEISVSSGTSIGLFAHELKHAYQFETGGF